MIDIRPARDAETESFLSLLCEVFDLDFARAQGIFFNEPLYDPERKWALFENGQMVSILTTVPLSFGWGNAIGIAGVATKADRRNHGLAAKLLTHVLEESERRGESAAFLFAKETTVYERVGFKVIDEVVKAPIVTANRPYSDDTLDPERVHYLYDRWAEGHPDRLRRDERRWDYWKWNYKVCTPFLGGYMCQEGTTIRECLTNELQDAWPLPHGANWLGLSTMARHMGVPITNPKVDLLLMARNAPGVPLMFMTDQF